MRPHAACMPRQLPKWRLLDLKRRKEGSLAPTVAMKVVMVVREGQAALMALVDPEVMALAAPAVMALVALAVMVLAALAVMVLVALAVTALVAPVATALVAGPKALI